MFMLSRLVGTLCGFGCGAAALAQNILLPLPPQVTFISNGKYTGTFQTQGMTLPIKGSLAYLTGDTQYIKLQVLFDTGGQQITRDSFVKATSTAINEWEIVSTDPKTCRKEVLSGPSYPQCTAWSRTPRGLYISECIVTEQGNQATLDFSVQLSTDNKLVQMRQNTTIDGMTDSLTVIMASQGTTPPIPSDFDPPSICSAAPNGNNQGDNDNSQGNEVGTIPLQLLLWLI
jgi:hypothetical protein